MPVAFRILSQAVDDILSHPMGAIVCLLPTVVGVGMALAVVIPVIFWLQWLVNSETREAHAFQAFLLIVVLVLLVGVGLCWTAVAWHRKIILGKKKFHLLPSGLVGLIARYFGASILIGILIMLTIIPFAFVLPFINDLMPLGEGETRFDLGGAPPNFAPPALLVWLIFNGLCLGFLFRLSLALPALSLGKAPAFGDNWLATEGHFFSVFLPLGVLLPVIDFVFGLLSSLVSFGGVLEILSACLFFLLGIGIVTRLYMHFVLPGTVPDN